MEHAEVELFLCREMPHTGHKRLPERAISRPFRKCAVHIGVVDGGFAIGVCRDREALPLHPRIEHPQDEIEDPMITQFAFRPALGQREVREDKCGELQFGELDGNGRRFRLLCRCAHHAKASFEEFLCELENQIYSYTTIG